MVAEKTLAENMFANSLLETSWAQRTSRGWTTVTSFGVEVVVISLLLLLPLWRTIGLPKARTLSTPVTVGMRSAEPSPTTGAPHASQVQRNFAPARIVAPGRRRPSTAPGDDSVSNQTPSEVCCGPDIGVGVPDGPPLPITGSRPIVLPPPPAPRVREFRTSNMLEGSLIRRVQPIYPYAAKVAHIQGKVVLAATIGKAGTIDNLQVMSGHPLLVGAAIDAVRQWRYRPYILNGEAIEVETQITVNFMLSQ